jgi:NTE family protein
VQHFLQIVTLRSVSGLTPQSALARCICGLLVGLLAACSHVPPSPEPVAPSVTRPRLALVLGGGAARGFAHIGVIQALEEAGIKPDMVVGTSAGSLVAALYASGKGGAELQRIALGMDEISIADWTIPLLNRGLLRGEALSRFVSTQVGGRTIEQMVLPLGIVATDFQSGAGVLFRRGDVATAVRASSAIPGLFAPVRIGNVEYVDGGLVSPVPVPQAREMGAQVILAVDVSTSPEQGKTATTLEMILQTTSIMGRTINTYALQGQDVVVVRPSLAGHKSTDFSNRQQLVDAGRHAMQQSLPKLKLMLAAHPAEK